MNVFLSVMLILLLLVNFFAVLATSIAIDTTYKFSDLFVNSSGNSFGYCLSLVAVTCAIIIANIALAGVLDESGYTGFAVLIQIAFLLNHILLTIFFVKINYKRNIKPSLQIKL